MVALGIMAALAALAGCGPSGPSERELRAALIAQVRDDDAFYNQRMDRWGRPKPEIDGSSFSMVRSYRESAVKPSELGIRKTGGRTTTYEADVPRIIQTYIKTGLTEEECLAASPRELEPQRVTDKYEYEMVRRAWHRANPLGMGGGLGL